MILVDQQICDYCGTCVGVCPENCIDLGSNNIAIDISQCTECRQCEYACPLEAIHLENNGEIPDDK